MTQYTRFRYDGQRQWTARGRRLTSEGLRRGLEHVFGVSQQQVPLDEATLQRSGKVNVDGLEGSISYDTVYAVIQHERMDFNHPLPGRKAKYLEDPMTSERAVVLRMMAVGLRRWLRG
ncbi:hypothetical protein [Streptomyces lunaelactis]|uniref:hypothetical protein n=1 Tax=Streptomyces lunaelactis TaxID=1535768 RepID=UPI0015844909|nr:hypothetical protein [Streptomyces lunaelactis]NUK22070.1 hypothetical protein [Streptomyces lunaelactis]